MKLFTYMGFAAALIYLQSCGGKMIKDTSDTTQATGSTAKITVSPVNNHIVINDEKDLLGYWVGKIILSNPPHPVTMTDEDYLDRISVSIDEIDGAKIKGHILLIDQDTPYEGTIEKNGSTFTLSMKGTDTVQNNRRFKFSIARNDSVLKGTSKIGDNPQDAEGKYRLTKKLFHYDANNKLEYTQFLDVGKVKKTVYKQDDGTKDIEESYLATTDDVNKYNPSVDELTKEQVANLKKGDLIILRNSIFARHGYTFKKQPLREFFERQSWYVPVNADVNNELTAKEKKNLELLQRYEKNAKEYYEAFGR